MAGAGYDITIIRVAPHKKSLQHIVTGPLFVIYPRSNVILEDMISRQFQL